MNLHSAKYLSLQTFDSVDTAQPERDGDLRPTHPATQAPGTSARDRVGDDLVRALQLQVQVLQSTGAGEENRRRHLVAVAQSCRAASLDHPLTTRLLLASARLFIYCGLYEEAERCLTSAEGAEVTQTIRDDLVHETQLLQLHWALEYTMLQQNRDARCHLQTLVGARQKLSLDGVVDLGGTRTYSLLWETANILLWRKSAINVASVVLGRRQGAGTCSDLELALCGLSLTVRFSRDGHQRRATQFADQAMGHVRPYPGLRRLYMLIRYQQALLAPTEGKSAERQPPEMQRFVVHLLAEHWRDRAERAGAISRQLDLQVANSRLRRRADAYLLDPLTELGNRRAIDERLQGLIDRADPHSSLAVAFIDIDDFKQINDTYTHLVGDEVIRAVARELRSGFPEDALIARYGGEEFVVALPECDLVEAARQLDIVRSSISRLVAVDGMVQVTVSVGIAASFRTATTELMLSAADQAMLTAKARGKNMVVLAGEHLEEPGHLVE